MSKKRRQTWKESEKLLKHKKGPNGYRLCRHCLVEVMPPRRTFCSDLCVHEYKLRSNHKYLREKVYERDLGICVFCKKDTRMDVIAIENKKREVREKYGVFSYAPLAVWETDEDFLEFLKGYKLTRIEASRSLWQADHINPVHKGGGLCDLSGMQTVCIQCHKEKTKRDRNEAKGVKKSKVPKRPRNRKNS